MISGDGVFTHICIGAKDLGQSASFYDAALGALGVQNMGPFGDNIMLYGKDKPALLVLKPSNGQPATSANGGTIGFAAPDKASVDAFHAAGLANGGTCEGLPGGRALPNSYAAYLRDPAGNKICAYHFTAGE
jgi:catechol 2,3-dioxygenase-like lactoylglutathione lyase family enzyme